MFLCSTNVSQIYSLIVYAVSLTQRTTSVIKFVVGIDGCKAFGLSICLSGRKACNSQGFALNSTVSVPPLLTSSFFGCGALEILLVDKYVFTYVLTALTYTDGSPWFNDEEHHMGA